MIASMSLTLAVEPNCRAGAGCEDISSLLQINNTVRSVEHRVKGWVDPVRPFCHQNRRRGCGRPGYTGNRFCPCDGNEMLGCHSNGYTWVRRLEKCYSCDV